jgi:serine/threonine protein phosphatase PrpC
MSTSHLEKVSRKSGEKEKGAAKSLQEGSILDLFPDYATSQKRMFVLGTTSEIVQKGFADKKVQRSASSDDSSKAESKDFRIGYACKKGLKPESPNQDDFCIFVTDNVSIFGVFDGHGPYGHDISGFVHEILPEILVKDERFKEDPAQASVAMKDAFPKAHQLCIDSADARNFDCALSGTTATLALLEQDSLHIANVGDSRAVLARGSRGGELRAEELTKDHKPDCEAESRRIIASGKGQVRRLEGDIPKRVFLKDKMYPGLAMTRSIGDTVGVDAGVISIPDVSSKRIEQDWRFLLLCSDGVWEFITSQEAVDLVSRYHPSDCQKGAEALASESWNRWIKEEGNVVDDITVILYWFSDK